jgi:L-methionine (R)-S-oxide reductase
MSTSELSTVLNHDVDYDTLIAQAGAMFADEHHRIANAGNLSALVYHGLRDLNWAGFYFLEQGELVLGPFNGKPACVRIALDRGVCGAAATRRETIVVEDVHAFPGHIACDAASRSEIVVPIVIDDQLVGVFDVDSPVPGRFGDADRQGMESLVRVFTEGTDLS